MSASLSQQHGRGRAAIEAGYAEIGMAEIQHVLGDEATPELLERIRSRRALAELGRLASLQVWERDGRLCWPKDSAPRVVVAVRMLVEAVRSRASMWRVADCIRDLRLGDRHQVDVEPVPAPDAADAAAAADDDVDHLVRKIIEVIGRDELDHGAMADAVIVEALASAMLVRLRCQRMAS